MKKILLVLIMVLMVGMVFADISEQDVRDKYEKKGGFSNRDVWLYEFNSIASELIRDSTRIQEGFAVDTFRRSFNNNCVIYKVLLDIGVEMKYITDTIRKQQMSKAEVERKKVAQYLASQSSGLGLE